jgi:SAM-dependent methyltransferase
MASEIYQGVDNLDVMERAVRYNRFLVDCILRAATPARTAVDFGAGTGTLSVPARDRGLTVTCVESDPRLREILEGLGFEVRSDLRDLPDSSQEFIYSSNVLEHIEDDEGILSAMYSKVRPGGRVFIYVPAFNALYSTMDRKIGHYRRYHKSSLTRKAQRCGFTVERANYADSVGFFAALLYKFIGSRRGDISVRGVVLYDRLVFPVSRMLDKIGLSRLFGKNLMVTLRRPVN